jgi:predicted phosphohydrolase
MDIFGVEWLDHTSKIKAAWEKSVGAEDLVIVAGDISWAMKFQHALEDLAFLDSLPGRKVLIRGNHDYWWSSTRKVEESSPQSLLFVDRTACKVENIVIAGTRGWWLPTAVEEVTNYFERGEEHLNGSEDGQQLAWTEQDEKTLAREVGRLEIALKSAHHLRESEEILIVALHFPPLYESIPDTPFTELIDQFRPYAVVYGHLHGSDAHAAAFEGNRNATHYHLVSADHTGFKPVEIVSL